MPEPLVIEPPHFGIHVAQSNGTGLIRSTRTHYEINHLHFSPADSTKIVAEIFTKDIDGDGRICEPNDLYSTEIAILKYYENGLITLDPTVGILTNNYASDPENHMFSNMDVVPVWSPDGDMVLFSSGLDTISDEDLDLFILDADRKETDPGEPNENVRKNLTDMIIAFVENPANGCSSDIVLEWSDDIEPDNKLEADPDWIRGPMVSPLSSIVFTRTTTIDGARCWEEDEEEWIDCPASVIWMVEYKEDTEEVTKCPVKVTDTSDYYDKACDDEGTPPCPLGDTDPKFSKGDPWGGGNVYKVAFDRKTGENLFLGGASVGNYDLYYLNYA